MKNKCVICGSRKGKRICMVRDDEPVCAICCAENRNDACRGCRHYSSSKRSRSNAPGSGENGRCGPRVDPDVDRAVDDVLQLLDAGQTRKAEIILNTLLRSHPDCHMVNFAAGTLLICRKKYNAAIEYFRKAIEIFPDFMEAHFNIAACYRNELDLRNMVESYRKVIELGEHGDEIAGIARKAISRMEENIMETDGLSLEQYFRAQDIFESAISHMEKCEWADAILRFRECLDIHMLHVQSYGNLGICLARTGEREQAVRSFEKALEIDPEYEPAIINKAMVESLDDGELLEADQVIIEDYYKSMMR